MNDISESNSKESIAVLTYLTCRAYGKYEEVYQGSLGFGLTPKSAHNVASGVVARDPFVLSTGISPETFRHIYESPELRSEARSVCMLPDPTTWARAAANAGPTVGPWDGIIRRPPGDIFADQVNTLRYQPFSFIGFGIGMLKYPDDPSLSPKERHDNREKQLQVGQLFGTVGDLVSGAKELRTPPTVKPAPNSQRFPPVFEPDQLPPVSGPPPAPAPAQPVSKPAKGREKAPESEKTSEPTPDAGSKRSDGKDPGSRLDTDPASEADMFFVFNDLPTRAGGTPMGGQPDTAQQYADVESSEEPADQNADAAEAPPPPPESAGA